MNNIEKIVLALALALFVFIFSDNIGWLIYGPDIAINKVGYQIEVKNKDNSNVVASNPLTDDFNMDEVLANANAAKGEKIFKKCSVCHTNDKNGENKVGPNLWNIVDSRAGQKDGFDYSNAMTKRGQDGKIWNLEELYRYLYSPKSYVSGTKMAFSGIKDDQERSDLLAYLITLSDKIANK